MPFKKMGGMWWIMSAAAVTGGTPPVTATFITGCHSGAPTIISSHAYYFGLGATGATFSAKAGSTLVVLNAAEYNISGTVVPPITVTWSGSTPAGAGAFTQITGTYGHFNTTTSQFADAWQATLTQDVTASVRVSCSYASNLAVTSVAIAVYQIQNTSGVGAKFANGWQDGTARMKSGTFTGATSGSVAVGFCLDNQWTSFTTPQAGNIFDLNVTDNDAYLAAHVPVTASTIIWGSSQSSGDAEMVVVEFKQAP